VLVTVEDCEPRRHILHRKARIFCFQMFLRKIVSLDGVLENTVQISVKSGMKYLGQSEYSSENCCYVNNLRGRASFFFFNIFLDRT